MMIRPVFSGPVTYTYTCIVYRGIARYIANCRCLFTNLCTWQSIAIVHYRSYFECHAVSVVLMNGRNAADAYIATFMYIQVHVKKLILWQSSYKS